MQNLAEDKKDDPFFNPFFFKWCSATTSAAATSFAAATSATAAAVPRGCREGLSRGYRDTLRRKGKDGAATSAATCAGRGTLRR